MTDNVQPVRFDLRTAQRIHRAVKKIEATDLSQGPQVAFTAPNLRRFWAKLTSSTYYTPTTSWRYAWTEQIRTTDGFTDKTAGRTGTTSDKWATNTGTDEVTCPAFVLITWDCDGSGVPFFTFEAGPSADTLTSIISGQTGIEWTYDKKIDAPGSNAHCALSTADWRGRRLDSTLSVWQGTPGDSLAEQWPTTIPTQILVEVDWAGADLLLAEASTTNYVVEVYLRGGIGEDAGNLYMAVAKGAGTEDHCQIRPIIRASALGVAGNCLCLDCTPCVQRPATGFRVTYDNHISPGPPQDEFHDWVNALVNDHVLEIPWVGDCTDCSNMYPYSWVAGDCVAKLEWVETTYPGTQYGPLNFLASLVFHQGTLGPEVFVSITYDNETLQGEFEYSGPCAVFFGWSLTGVECDQLTYASHQEYSMNLCEAWIEAY